MMEGAFFPLPLSNLIFIALDLSMLFSFCPSPVQKFLKSIYSRGKLVQSSPSSSPPKFTVPQRFFLHFYIIGSLFNSLLLLVLLVYILLKPSFIGDNKMSNEEAWKTFLLLFLFELQVLRRLYEDMFVTKFSSSARMHILAYLCGILYYIVVPLSLFPSGYEFLVKGVQGLMTYGHDEIKIQFQGWKPFLQIGWLYWLSSVLFMWGWFHQHRCHMILASLRSKRGEDHSYKIPYGDWFEYVSSAHYLAELVMYFSFVVARAGRNLDTLLLFSFVAGNLGVTAVETHKWYKEKFEDYPASRKAIIPFLY